MKLGGQKVASLHGDVSTASNVEGLAFFPNLTVAGSTSKFVFIHFLFEGEVRSVSVTTYPACDNTLMVHVVWCYAVVRG